LAYSAVDALVRHQASGIIRHGKADPARITGITLVAAHQAGKGLQDRVGCRALGVRAGLAEAGDRAINHIGRDRFDRFIANAQPVGYAGPVAFQEDVAARSQL
jgi:hypothetical protein